MMNLNFIKKNPLIISKRYYSITIDLDEEELSIYGLLLEENNEDFEIIRRFNGLDLKGFKKQINHFYPVLLNIVGSKIITKIIDNSDTSFNSLMLRGTVEDYFFDQIISGDSTLVSYCKKEIFIGINTILLKNEIIVSSVSLGPGGLIYLRPYTSLKSEISSFNHTVKFVHNTLDSVTIKKEREINELLIQNDKFDSNLFNSLGHYISFKLDRYTNNDVILANRQDHSYMKIFIAGVPIMIGIMLLVIVSSHFYKKSLSNKLIANQAKISFYQQNEQLVNSLKSEIANKEKILVSSGFATKTSFTQQISELVNKNGNEVSLIALTVQPLSRKLNKKEKVELLSRQIEINGVSISEKSFDQYLRRLNEIDWISKIDIISYGKNKDGASEFYLKLYVK